MRGRQGRDVVRGLAERAGIASMLGRGRSLVDAKYKRARLDDEHLRLLIAFALGPDSHCIDIGANRGTVLAEILRVAPRGRHIAYEPIPHLAEHLRARFPSVDVRCAAASNRRGESSFAHVESREAYSGLKARAYPGKETVHHTSVRVEDLDSALPADYVPALIKIDVEGAEQQVLEGAIRVISDRQPVVVFEHGKGGADHYGTAPADVYSLLCDEARLRIFDLDGNGPYSLSAFEATFERNDYWNFVAHA